MGFQLPPYNPPDFADAKFADAPLAVFKPVEQDGVAPEDYHATSVYPEYVHVRPGH